MVQCLFSEQVCAVPHFQPGSRLHCQWAVVVVRRQERAARLSVGMVYGAVVRHALPGGEEDHVRAGTPVIRFSRSTLYAARWAPLQMHLCICMLFSLIHAPLVCVQSA